MLGAMLDLSRNGVMKPNEVCRFADVLKKIGYDTLALYLEDTYEISGEPYFGHLRGRYSKDELKQINAHAKSIGMRILPCIQTLAHLNGMFRWEQYADINDAADILLIDEPKTYALIEKMFMTMRECFDCETINIGMDEAWNVGLGNYLKKHGYSGDRVNLIYKHLLKVVDIAKKYNFKCMMWSDMFFHLNAQPEEMKKLIPDGVILCHWDYYHIEKDFYDNKLSAKNNPTSDIAFAGGGWTWGGFAAMNRRAIETMRPAMLSCRENGIKDVIITLWGDDGRECSPYAVLPSLLFCAEKYLNDSSDEEIKNKFKSLFGADFDDFMLLDLPIDYKYLAVNCVFYSDPFCGKYDYYIKPGDGKYCTGYSEKLRKAAVSAGEYAYIFECMAAFSDVIEIKYDLGVRTREAYVARNKNELKGIAESDYAELISRLEAFADLFYKLWNKECKPFGLEIQQIRIGGLISRLKWCQRVLIEYLQGKLDRIDELEEPVLPVKIEEILTPFDHNYLGTISLNRM